MQAASARHLGREPVRRRGWPVYERARHARRWSDMENRHVAPHYSKEGFKVHLRFVMPCRAHKLRSQVGETQGISFAGRKS